MLYDDIGGVLKICGYDQGIKGYSFLLSFKTFKDLCIICFMFEKNLRLILQNLYHKKIMISNNCLI